MPVTSELEEEFYNGIQQFAVSFYKRLFRDEGSFVISPVSIYICLALIYCGASGHTAKELREGLYLPSDNKKKIGDLIRRMIEYHRRFSHMSFASNIFFSNDLNVKKEFKEIAINYFRMKPERINFTRNIAAARILNDFVLNNTDGKIEHVCSRSALTPDMHFAVVCAFTFNAKWKHPFLRQDSVRGNFWTTTEQSTEMVFMVQTQVFNYLQSQNLDANVLEMPYKDENFSLVIILPNERNNLRNVETKLDSIGIFFEAEKMVPTHLTVKLPLSSIATGCDLREKLARMGIGKMFSFDAELDELCSGTQEKISKFFAKTIFHITEDGSEPSQTFKNTVLNLPHFDPTDGVLNVFGIAASFVLRSSYYCSGSTFCFLTLRCTCKPIKEALMSV